MGWYYVYIIVALGETVSIASIVPMGRRGNTGNTMIQKVTPSRVQATPAASSPTFHHQPDLCLDVDETDAGSPWPGVGMLMTIL